MHLKLRLQKNYREKNLSFKSMITQKLSAKALSRTRVHSNSAHAKTNTIIKPPSPPKKSAQNHQNIIHDQQHREGNISLQKNAIRRAQNTNSNRLIFT